MIEGVGVKKFGDMRQDVIYDRVQIPAANPKGTELVWFRDIQSKTRLDTNMSLSSKLPENQEALVYRINFMIQADCPPKDVQKVAALAYGEMVLDDDNRVMSGPIAIFASSKGLYGNIMTTANNAQEGVVSMGVPSPGAIPRLMLPIYISENRTFRFNVHFYEVCDLPSGSATYAWVILDSLVTRPLR